MNQPQQAGVQIKTQAILAAILFNLGKTEKVKITPDDGSGKEIEVESAIVGLESKDDALVCVIPMDRVYHFATTPYEAVTMVQGDMVIVTFEKQKPASRILTATGRPVAHQSDTIKELLARLHG